MAALQRIELWNADRQSAVLPLNDKARNGAQWLNRTTDRCLQGNCYTT